MMNLILTLSLFTAVNASLASGKAFVKRTPAVLDIRGGAEIGPIDADLSGKALTALSLLTGAQDFLAPSVSADLYNIKTTPLVTNHITAIGAYGLGTGLMAYASIYQGASTNTAIGVGVLPLIALMTRMILNDEPKEWATDIRPFYGMLVFYSLTVYSTLTNQDYAGTLIKVLAGYNGAIAVGMVLAPAATMKAFTVKDKDADDPRVLASTRAFGFNIAAYAAMVFLLQDGRDALQSLGYSIAIRLLQIVGKVVTGEAAAEGLNVNGLAFWIVVLGVLTGAILL